MNANIHIGEQAVHVWGRDFVFRPLFYRVAQLGTPKEILDIFNQAQTVGDDGFIAAWRVMAEFCDDENIDNLIGYFYYCEKLNRLRYVRGKMPIEDIHIIGASLITDALIGRPTNSDKVKASKEAPSTEFNPAEFVAIGNAHFSGIDWWGKTMIELQQAIKAHNPEKEEKLPTAKEIGDMFADAEATNARIANG
jgi:hypothetical protein